MPCPALLCRPPKFRTARQFDLFTAIELEQVERDQHRVAFSSLPVAQPVEYGEPIFVAGDDLAIDQAGPGREM